MVNVLDFVASSKATWEVKYKDFLKPVRREILGSVEGKLVVLFGLRGSGKTTLLFQKFDSIAQEKRIYFNGDEIGLLKISLLDLFSALDGFIPKDSVVFIDEINSVSNWAQELKIIYDKYSFKLIVSGSSSLNLKASRNFLARRAKYIYLKPLSFREFVKIKMGVDLSIFDFESKNILYEMAQFESQFRGKIERNSSLVVEDFLDKNLPFLFDANESMVFDLVDKIIYDDIAKEYNFSSQVMGKFERLLFLLSGSNKITYENVSKDLGVAKSVVGEMISALEESGLIIVSLPFGTAKSVARKEWRYFFAVPFIRKLFMQKAGLSKSDMVGLLYEDLFVSSAQKVFFLKTGPDFVFEEKIFEISSKGKSFSQLLETKLKMKKFLIQNTTKFDTNQGIIVLPFYMFLSKF